MTHEFLDTKTDRTYRFDGELLAEASTNGGRGRPRWSELKLFKTPTGTYILVKAGRSIQFHMGRACAGPHAQHVTGKSSVQEVVQSGIPCPKCFDPRTANQAPSVFKENDLVTVVTSKDAKGIVESAHIMDEDKVLFLPRFAQQMLKEASARDEGIREAYRVEFVA